MDISNFIYLLADDNCNGLGPIVHFIHQVYTILQWGIPVVLIVYGGFDLAKAVIASDDKEIKAAATKLVKRLIAAVAVFLLTTIVSVIITWAAEAEKQDGSDVDSSWMQCWNGQGSSNNGSDSGDV